MAAPTEADVYEPQVAEAFVVAFVFMAAESQHTTIQPARQTVILH